MGEDKKLQNFSILKCCISHSYLQAKCSLTEVKIGSRIQLFFFLNSSSVVMWKAGKERGDERNVSGHAFRILLHLLKGKSDF